MLLHFVILMLPSVSREELLISSNITLLNQLTPENHQERSQSQLFRVGRSGFAKRVKVGTNDLIYFDRIPALESSGNLSALRQGKQKILSILVFVDLRSGLTEKTKQVLQQANGSIDVFFAHSDMPWNQTLSVYHKAFGNYRFSLILEEGQSYLSSALVNAIMMHTVPIYNGFFEISGMFANGVAAWNEFNVNIAGILRRVSELNKKIKFLWSYQQILQEILFYRYMSSPGLRAQYTSQNLPVALQKPLAFVGVYSKLSNRNLRDSIRATWKKVFEKQSIEVVFLLSSGSLSDIELTAYKDEADKNGDIGFLNVSEGYRYNSRKGVAFAKWIRSNRSNFQYIIKTDDDIYFRPEPLLVQLQHRIPLGYVWGFIDYISPVPKNISDPFYSPPQMYPFSTFPTYPRGAVRVLSTDLLVAIAEKADKKQLRMIYGDDPTMGVHLRQLIMERDVPFINIDDFGSYKNFAMQPSCNSQWSSVKNETWVIHHVNESQIACLWEKERSGKFPACECL